jgi:N utilization substance protein B
MQSLYEWDFKGKIKNELSTIVKHNLVEFAPGIKDDAFTRDLADGVLRHLEEIDALIKKYATQWPIDQITTIDRNVLRLGIFELVFYENTPSRVAINEAIEVAKSFGGESSGKFINGVLGAIYKDRMDAGQIKEADKETKIN